MVARLFTYCHRPSIRGAIPRTHRRRHAPGTFFGLVVACAALGGPAIGRAAEPDGCGAAAAGPGIAAGRAEPLRGIGTVAWQAELVAGHDYLVEVTLRGNDALAEVLDAGGRLLGSADHPERRSGTRRLWVAAGTGGPVTIRVTGKEHAQVTGTVARRVLDVAALPSPACTAALRLLAAADADYAAGQEISRGRAAREGSARHSFLRAAEGYRAAWDRLSTAAEAGLRGQAALALAGVEYFDLQNWAAAADWAERAAAELAAGDPYRQARAEAVLAAAWIELATTVAPGQPVPGVGIDAAALLQRANRLLERLAGIHDRRGEHYDAALQVNNVGLAHLYVGRFAECAGDFRSAERRFAALREGPRAALAAQNRSMCLWGLGDLAAALAALEQALKGLRPDPYPILYLGTLNNAALLHYALGNLDAALRLNDQALALALKVQSTRDEAQSLFGIGVTYYALGERQRARQFLERSLAIRSVAFDARGRMSTLRALATIDGEDGRAAEAIAHDREALALAKVPAAAASIRIQTAMHTAAAGRRAEALRLLDAEVAEQRAHDPLVRGTALLQRAILRRQGGDAPGALADLASAAPLLRHWGTVTDGFVADLETARALRLLGRTAEALAAVERALGRASAIRLQTANPELRAALQSPLRQAYELKVDLLWHAYEPQAGTAGAAALAAAAFEAADASRAHTFADIAAQQYPLALRRALAGQFARRESLYRDIAARRFALEQHQDAVGSSDARALQMQADIEGLERRLDTVNGEIAARAARGGAIVRGRGAAPDVARRLPERAALVSYWLGPDDAYAWVIARGGVHWIRLARSAEVTGAARALHDALARPADVPASARMQAAADLYDRIVRPLEGWLEGTGEWVIVPDAALSYVPFAALRGGGRTARFFVAAAHDVALAPAAWMLRAESPAGAPRNSRMLLVADPVYERQDPRLHGDAAAAPTDPRSGSALADAPEAQRLPWSAREAAGIAAEFPAGAVDRLEGAAATREAVLGRDWRNYRYIHLATHGVTDARNPQYSALLLSRYDAAGRPQENAVRVADLALLTLDADVVVFSACDTALGKEVLNEGLVGLGYTTLARGARAVVASLWPVADEMSARLMTDFYRHLLRGSVPPPAALGAAMRAVLARDPTADPALWAPFQVSTVTVPAGAVARVAGMGPFDNNVNWETP